VKVEDSNMSVSVEISLIPVTDSMQPNYMYIHYHGSSINRRAAGILLCCYVHRTFYF